MGKRALVILIALGICSVLAVVLIAAGLIVSAISTRESATAEDGSVFGIPVSEVPAVSGGESAEFVYIGDAFQVIRVADDPGCTQVSERVECDLDPMLGYWPSTGYIAMSAPRQVGPTVCLDVGVFFGSTHIEHRHCEDETVVEIAEWGSYLDVSPSVSEFNARAECVKYEGAGITQPGAGITHECVIVSSDSDYDGVRFFLTLGVNRVNVVVVFPGRGAMRQSVTPEGSIFSYTDEA